MRYTQQKVFAFNSLAESVAVVPDSGTSLTIEFWSGTEWVEDAKSPLSSPDKVYVKGVRLRITPSTGGFMIDDEVAL